ncbi:hypothetical protein Marky_0184 [Marinithermus hydrothermalis DSM 14884]|uniref:Uncharacterized protein n=1 Tax=Marinithermus hydrothermalis (strain DSM 14884 / JCM 11576 / T1) TaxID=869210 RepID=F2NNA6_MARHT|nr:hypothetical protein Marky_0184 [Marinithermus hydrothermalis DSM 14884]
MMGALGPTGSGKTVIALYLTALKALGGVESKIILRGVYLE